MLGLLKADPAWLVRSNEESGDGYADILVETDDVDAGIIFELKYVLNMKDVNDACKRAIEQIQSKRYDERFRNDEKKYPCVWDSILQETVQGMCRKTLKRRMEF